MREISYEETDKLSPRALSGGSFCIMLEKLEFIYDFAYNEFEVSHYAALTVLR
jgi:hypothetical protein